MSKSEIRDYTSLDVEHLAIGEVILHEEEIIQRIEELAADIAEVYRGRNLLLVGLLKGATQTTIELGKALHKLGLDAEVDYLQVKAGYNERLESEGRIEINDSMMKTDVSGHDILIVDDIGDSLSTFTGVANHLAAKGAISIDTFALLDKPSRHKVEFQIGYVGFKIPGVWVEGFGMDSYGHGRFNRNIVKGPTYVPPQV